jgi:hypothetical protein
MAKGAKCCKEIIAVLKFSYTGNNRAALRMEAGDMKTLPFRFEVLDGKGRS